jgi:hypothetical protein
LVSNITSAATDTTVSDAAMIPTILTTMLACLRPVATHLLPQRPRRPSERCPHDSRPLSGTNDCGLARGGGPAHYELPSSRLNSDRLVLVQANA